MEHCRWKATFHRNNLSIFSIREHGMKCDLVIEKVVIHTTGEGEVIFKS